MPSDIEGIDDIVEGPTSVQLIFVVQRDWLADADQAHQELAWKSDRCASFLRSPQFRERFGKRPGSLVLRAARQPPGDVLTEMARLGADVEVGTVPLYRAGSEGTNLPVHLVSCAMCGKGGFVNNQMSMTDRGFTCPSCFTIWNGQQEALYRTMSGSRSNNMVWLRVLVGVGVAIVFGGLRACM